MKFNHLKRIIRLAAILLLVVIFNCPIAGQCEQPLKAAASDAKTASGAIKLPLFRPTVDQLGEMEGNVTVADRMGLAFTLYMTMLLTVAIFIIGVTHWPMRTKRSG